MQIGNPCFVLHYISGASLHCHVPYAVGTQQ